MRMVIYNYCTCYISENPTHMRSANLTVNSALIGEVYRELIIKFFHSVHYIVFVCARTLSIGRAVPRI